MRVDKSVRKLATLYMLYHRSSRLEGGKREEFSCTSYTVASWHWLAQSSVWHILEELVASRFVSRETNQIYPLVIHYQITKRGRKHLANHYAEGKDAMWAVRDWKHDKYKRSQEKSS